MRRANWTFGSAATIAALLLVAGPARAAGGGGQSDTAVRDVKGKVEKIDHDAKELKLSDSDKTFRLSDSTHVMKAGQQAALSDIQEGDEIRASYSGSGETPELSHIEVTNSGTGRAGTSSGSATNASEGEKKQVTE